MADEFTLADLAERLGMQSRTIRSYIEQGLLRGPEVGGRGARYTTYHLHRLQAIRTLKELRGLSLADVRRQLLGSSSTEIEALAVEGEVARTTPGSIPEAASALDYIRRVTHGQPNKSEAEQPPGAPTPMDVLLARLDQLNSGAKSPPRRSRGETWTSIPLTPDVEIRVRGALTADALSRWERIADHLREILMGGGAR